MSIIKISVILFYLLIISWYEMKLSVCQILHFINTFDSIEQIVQTKYKFTCVIFLLYGIMYIQSPEKIS